ncbi:MAG: hypothetical protein KC449_02220 [Anaerolineales bacterium]|nr:hypothetical protein [Anaerolineales bacterium]
MTTPNVYTPKNTVNRLILFFLIGFTTATPLWVFGFYFSSGINIFLMPLVVFIVLIIMLLREKKVSSVKPGLLEYFLSFLGAFYPPVLASIALWVVWWGAYGLGSLFASDGELFGAAYDFAGVVYGVFSLGLASFLVRMNWRHVTDQLYPQVGRQSAFAKITAAGKLWLVKRGIILSVVFFVFLVVYFVIAGIFFSEGEDFTVGDEFLFGLFFIVIYLFFVSVSAWLWLLQPMNQLGLSEANEVVARALKPLGYKIRTVTELKNEPRPEVEISDFMTASVDLVAGREDGSLVIDVMTLEETTEAPDWVMASEFRSATWYLQKVLQLPSPVEAVFVLVDVLPDESLLAFAEDHDIKLIQLSSDVVAEWFAEQGNEPMAGTEATALFSSLMSNGHKNGSASMEEPMLISGGQNG